MSLNSEWRDRINAWMSELRRQLFVTLGPVELEAFFTHELLHPRDAAKGQFAPVSIGQKWGEPYQYGWFRSRISVPPAADGKRLMLKFGATNNATLTLVNGQYVESHRTWWAGNRFVPAPLTLCRKVQAGQTLDLLVEAYAWHEGPVTSAWPTPEDVPAVRDVTGPLQTVEESTVGWWDEEAYQLLLDANTLLQIRDGLDAESLRVAEIDEALRDFTLIADPSLPINERHETYRAARERLAPALAARNGTVMPEYFCFGHGHLDVAWLWPLAETRRKMARTMSNQLELFAEYPEHKFLQSQPHLFRMLQEDYPELFEQVKKAVADGNLIADGGMWIEADTNVSGGEALIRQFLHGKRYFREQFGVENELLWLPDVFGYSAALPQILAGCGMKYFSTQKIFWSYHGGETFPRQNFLWEGIDGSTVIVHLHHDYNSHTDPASLMVRWKQRVQKDGMSSRLLPFGWGDGGGGPDRDHVEYLRRLGDCQGVPRTRYATPQEFFEDLVARGEHDRHRYVGELYFQAHRGVLTSQARTKRGNRKSELALREAEVWSVAAGAMGEGFAFPADKMDDAWKKVLLNQFHDILPGSSIARVYKEALELYAEVQAAADEVTQAATAALTDGDASAMTVFNSLSSPRRVLVALPEGWAGAIDEAGDSLCVQKTPDGSLVELELPACGWATLRRADAPREAAEGCCCDCGVKAGTDLLENAEIRVRLNDRGEIVSILDKSDDRELLAAPSNVFRMYKDMPTQFDAWDLDSMYKDQPVDLGDAPAEIEVLTAGPLLGAIRVGRKINRSTLVQTVRLRRGARTVEFDTTIQWHERRKLLKVCFVPDLHADEAIHEVQFGHVRRPNHASRPYDEDRWEVANQRWSALAEQGRGFAVLNDCKYGLNVVGKSINLSLLRATIAPDPRADQGEQRFTYGLHAWKGSLGDSEVVQRAAELNVPVQPAVGAARTPAGSMFSVDAPNVVIETVKPAEDGSGDVVVRLYECMRSATRCELISAVPFARADQTDMLEEAVQQPLASADGKVALSFRAFEVKTVRLRQR